MTTTSSGKRHPSDQEALFIKLTSALLFILGIGILVVTALSILNNDQLQRAIDGPEYAYGSGLDVQKIEIPNQSQAFAVSVVADSPAANQGLQAGDILTAIDSALIDLEIMSPQDVQNLLAAAFSSAQIAGNETIPIEVNRAGDISTIDLPVPSVTSQFELNIPRANTQDIGLGLHLLPIPYYILDPESGSPADADGIRYGDLLISVGNRQIDRIETQVTGDLPLEEVQSLVREDSVELNDDDFRLYLTYERLLPDGSTRTFDGRIINKRIPSSTLVAFMTHVGFVVPLLGLFLGLMIIQVGYTLFQNNLTAARWALVVFTWLSIGLFIVSLRNFWTEGKGGIVTDDPFDYGEGLLAALPVLIPIIPMAIALRWLSSVVNDIFEGEETLTQRNTRFAWSLLIPTVAVLLIVAARPLEQTFVSSLTDERLGGTQPPRWVGIDNYKTLLSIRFDVVDCQKDEDTGECKRTATGKQAIQWEDAGIVEEQDGRTLDLARQLSPLTSQLNSGELSPDESENIRDQIREISNEISTLADNKYAPATNIRLPNSDKSLVILGTDAEFIKSIGNTLRFTISSVVLELILGLVIAMVVNSAFAGRGLMRAAMLVPWAIPTVVAATLWEGMLKPDQSGIMNKLVVDTLGLAESNVQWLTALGPWMNSIIAVDVWKTTPFMALLLLAGLQTIPQDIYEAADVDGASKFRQFWSITLPLLRPTIAIALVFRTLDALRAFDVFQVLLGEDRRSMATHNFYKLTADNDVGYASSVGVVIFAFILIFTVIYVRFVGIDQQ